MPNKKFFSQQCLFAFLRILDKQKHHMSKENPLKVNVTNHPEQKKINKNSHQKNCSFFGDLPTKDLISFNPLNIRKQKLFFLPPKMCSKSSEQKLQRILYG